MWVFVYVYCDELVLKKKKSNPQRKALQRLSARLLSSLILLHSLLREKTVRRKREGDKSQDQKLVELEAAWEKHEYRQKPADLSNERNSEKLCKFS